jgi:UDP-glucuronate 4-epimerase
MTILVTGCAGFIGLHTSLSFLEKGKKVIGIDNLNAYYDPQLKKDRLALLEKNPNFVFEFMDFSDQEKVFELFKKYPEIEGIIHLGAQAGVRHSLTHPHDYVKANITGQIALMEGARKLKNLKHFIYASSSSVYGANTKMPFSVKDQTDSPLAPYGATKKAVELMAHSYAYLYNMPLTGFRFFTVYGPWGRPDMAAYIFAKNISEGKPIQIFNNGHMKRDFTFIADIVRGIVGCYDTPPNELKIPHRVFNLGNNKSEKLTDFIELIEKELGIKAKYEYKPMQPGDVAETYADIQESKEIFGFTPRTTIYEGIPEFIKWFVDYHKKGDRLLCKQVS